MTATVGGRPTEAFPNLSDPATFAAGIPHEAFTQMRETPGLYWQPAEFGTTNGGFWAVTRWEDIIAVEKDPATFTSTRGAAYPMFDLPADHFARDGLMLNDPPRHSHLRRAAAKGFGPRIVRNFEPWVREIISEELDRIEQLERLDFVIEIAQVVPARVIARVLGTPTEDQPQVVEWVIALFRILGDPARAGEFEGLVLELQRYAAKVQQVKKAQPADDMFTVLGQCVEQGELTQGEFVNWMQVMMGAGFETTHTTMGQSMRMYLEDADVRSATDRALAEGLDDGVTNEFVRLVSPVIQMARAATHDLEFAGESIREGDGLVLYYASANRDPNIFNNPDRFDPWRSEPNTLAFGSGVHRCIGEHLAKLEVRILWEEIHKRGLKPRLDGEPQRGWSVFINQLMSLPIAWS